MTTITMIIIIIIIITRIRLLKIVIIDDGAGLLERWSYSYRAAQTMGWRPERQIYEHVGPWSEQLACPAKPHGSAAAEGESACCDTCDDDDCVMCWIAFMGECAGAE